MKKMFNKLFLVMISLIVCVFSFIGCSSADSKDDKISASYENAMKLIDKGSYSEAYEMLLTLEDNADAKKALENFVFVYDKVSVEMQNIRYVTENTYDKNGNCIKSEASMNGELSQILESEYNDRGNVIKTTIKQADGTVVNEAEFSYEYDSNGNIIKHTAKRTIADVVTEDTMTYVYNEKNLLIKVQHDGYYEEFVYDENDFKIKVTSIADGASGYVILSYEYVNDDKGNVIKETMNDGINLIVTEYEYDDKGNQTKVTQTSGSAINVMEYEYSGLRIFYSERP